MIAAAINANPNGSGTARMREPDPAKMAARYGAETPVLDWRERLVCSRCASRQVDMVVSRGK
jgi:hypothetical protein